MRLHANGGSFIARAAGVLGRVLAFAAGAVLVMAGLMFSLLLFALAVAGTVLTLGYLWWKSRRMPARSTGGRVIEGEVIRDTTAS